MQNFVTSRWPLTAVILLLVMFGITPTFAVSLNGVTLGSNFRDVLAAKKEPTLIGPTLANISDISNILNPPPVSAASLAAAATDPSAGAAPSFGGVDPMYGGGGAGQAKRLKGDFEYIVWMYMEQKGGNGVNTYVIFDKEVGTVIQVIAWLTDNPRGTVSIPVPGKLTLGENFSKLLSTYGYPKSMLQIGSGLFLCAYPEKQVTFSFDSASRRVLGISIGDKSLAAIFNQNAASQGQSSSYSSSNGMLPGDPGSSPMQY